MIRRPILRYFGGKWRLAKWITSHFPPHDMYVEPFGGVASVLLRKPRSYGEVYNDLNGDLVNLFRVLRDKEKAEELERLIYLTPYARDEYEYACKLNKENTQLGDIERARLLLTEGHLCSHAYSGTKKAGFSSHISAKHHNNQAREWINFHPQIKLFTERLQGVLIENRDATKIIKKYDTPNTLFYVDPQGKRIILKNCL